MVGEGEADARLQHPTGRPNEDGDGSWLLGYDYSSERMDGDDTGVGEDERQWLGLSLRPSSSWQCGRRRQRRRAIVATELLPAASAVRFKPGRASPGVVASAWLGKKLWVSS